MMLTTIADPSLVHNADRNQVPSGDGDVPPPLEPQASPHTPHTASGEKAKARALLAAIRTLQAIEQAQRSATPAEWHVLARFPGCGPVARGLFPDPVTGRYPDATWQTLGEELRTLLSPDEYASARRTTFTAFYTAPVVIRAMHDALRHLGVPQEATVLEPGCGIGTFMALAPAGMRFIGVELDSIAGRIARVLHPTQDIRIEHFRDTHLPDHCIDAVLGNVPFADIRLDYHGMRLALHDFFLAKSLDALKPGGVLALVTSHYTLDKQHAGLREHLAHQADFLGAIRLPSTAFQQEGTRVVTDILCLRKRGAGEKAHHADPAWLETALLPIEGLEEALLAWMEQHADARLIIIDILEKVRPPRSKTQDTYGESYQATARLTRLAQERNLALLLVHHTNKANVLDARDSVSGPMSLLGGADTLWSLQRGLGEAESTLKITGRDVPEQELALRFIEGHWTLLGDAADYRRSQTRQEILDYLADCGQPLPPKQLADALGRQGPALRQCLRRMVEAGEVVRQRDGRYRVGPLAGVPPALHRSGSSRATGAPCLPGVTTPSADNGMPLPPARPLHLPQRPSGTAHLLGTSVPDVSASTGVTAMPPVTPVTRVTEHVQEGHDLPPVTEVPPSLSSASSSLPVVEGELPEAAPSARPGTPPARPPAHTPGSVEAPGSPEVLRTSITPVTPVTPVTHVIPVTAVTPVTEVAQENPHLAPAADRATPWRSDAERGRHAPQGEARADPLWDVTPSLKRHDSSEDYEEFIL